MSILNGLTDLVRFYPEFLSWDETKINALIIQANVYVEGQLGELPQPVPEDLKLATAMLVKEFSLEKKVTDKKVADSSWSYEYQSKDHFVNKILNKYSVKEDNGGGKLWMI